MDFELSSYQKDILDYFKNNPSSNMIINALAGSGKSSTACMLTEVTNTSDVYLAFNNSVAAEFKKKIKNPKTKVYTMHSLAYSIMNYNLGEKAKTSTGVKGFGVQRTALSTATLDNLKIHKIVEEQLKKQFGRYMDFAKKSFYKENYVTLYNLCRLTMTNCADSNAVGELVKNHALFSSEMGYEAPSNVELSVVLKNIEAFSLQEFERTATIDFTDMLYITYLKLKSKEWEVPYWNLYTNIYLDEAQDNSKLQLNFLYFIKRKNGRYIIILDKNQAIYGFAGGDTQAVANISRMFAPFESFDLPICYRCAKTHLEKVNKEFNIPIKPRANAPMGFIKKIDKEQVSDYAKSGDMVISRKNKWLSSVILNLVKNGIPVYIEDKEMVNNVNRLIKSAVTNKCQTVYCLSKYLSEIVAEQEKKAKEIARKLVAQNADGTAVNFDEIVDSNAKADNAAFILDILKGFVTKNSLETSITKFEDYVVKLLNTTFDDKCVRICSVHKAKGLEAENVFVLNEGKICYDFRNSKEQNIQEKNLSYISITRAKNGLYLVKEDKK